MNIEQKIEYKKLCRQVAEAHDLLYDKGTFGRRKDKKPNQFNNRLQRMKDFLSSLTDGDYSNNRFMQMNPIDDK